jgi:hypothetical protein
MGVHAVGVADFILFQEGKSPNSVRTASDTPARLIVSRPAFGPSTGYSVVAEPFTPF